MRLLTSVDPAQFLTHGCRDGCQLRVLSRPKPEQRRGTIV